MVKGCSLALASDRPGSPGRRAAVLPSEGGQEPDALADCGCAACNGTPLDRLQEAARVVESRDATQVCGGGAGGEFWGERVESPGSYHLQPRGGHCRLRQARLQATWQEVAGFDVVTVTGSPDRLAAKPTARWPFTTRCVLESRNCLHLNPRSIVSLSEAQADGKAQ